MSVDPQDIRLIHQWHRLADVMPLLENLLDNVEKRINAEVIALDPTSSCYTVAAVAACTEMRAIARFRKELTRVTKSGKTASHRVENKL